VGRKFGLTYLAAELLWYLSANNRTEWISKYSSFWSNISDDGKTANSAYGARLFAPHPAIADRRFVQWDYIVEELTRDPDSRRAVMHLRTPGDSIDAKLDVPCTLALQFFIREGKLHQVVHMRSSDVIFGIAYDVPAFTMFQEILANELNVGIGTYTHVSNSLHIYERHFKLAESILEPENVESSKSWARALCDNRRITESSLDDIRMGPVFDLMTFEQSLTGNDSAEAVITHLCKFNFVGFWSDMAIILAAKHMRDLGARSEARDLLATRLHESYRFFTRRG
jgi:thymidylate synthase